MRTKEITKEIVIRENKITNLCNDMIVPCQNKSCKFFDKTYKKNCSWIWFVNKCPDYKEK